MLPEPKEKLVIRELLCKRTHDPETGHRLAEPQFFTRPMPQEFWESVDKEREEQIKWFRERGHDVDES